MSLMLRHEGSLGMRLSKDHGKVVCMWRRGGVPLFTQEASKLKPRGRIVSQKFFGRVFVFLQRLKVVLSRSFL